MTGPVVSVVIPSFNAARFLPEAVLSVVAQRHRPLEVLIVDDGSTDDTPALARRLEAQHPEVRVLKHPNGANHGLPATRNLGIQHARGEFIGFLDADDVWLPHKLERQLEAAAHHPTAGVYAAPSIYWFSWTGRSADRAVDHVRRLDGELDALHAPPALLGGLLRSGAGPTTGSILVRREVFDRVGGFHPEMPQMYEDQVWLTKAFLSVPIYLGPEPLDRYRQHDESITARAGHGRADFYPLLTRERKVFLLWVAQYLEDRGIADPELLGALDVALAPYRHPFAHLVFHPTQLARSLAWRVMPARIRRRIWGQVYRLRHRSGLPRR